MNESPNLSRAHAALSLRRWEDAVREAGLAITTDPENAMGYYLLANALFALARQEEALAALASAQAKAPDWPALFVLRSDILREDGQAREAMDAAEAALRLAPDDPDSHAAVEMAFSALEEPRRGLTALEAACALRPSQTYPDAMRSNWEGDRKPDHHRRHEGGRSARRGSGTRRRAKRCRGNTRLAHEAS